MVAKKKSSGVLQIMASDAKMVISIGFSSATQPHIKVTETRFLRYKPKRVMNNTDINDLAGCYCMVDKMTGRAFVGVCLTLGDTHYKNPLSHENAIHGKLPLVLVYKQVKEYVRIYYRAMSTAEEAAGLAHYLNDQLKAVGMALDCTPLGGSTVMGSSYSADKGLIHVDKAPSEMFLPMPNPVVSRTIRKKNT
jgi:hypothetical protein